MLKLCKMRVLEDQMEYIEVELEVVEFGVEDLIVTSPCPTETDPICLGTQ